MWTHHRPSITWFCWHVVCYVTDKTENVLYLHRGQFCAWKQNYKLSKLANLPKICASFGNAILSLSYWWIIWKLSFCCFPSPELISRPYIHVESSSVLELTENFILNCSHDNGTRTTYRWFKGGKPLRNETRFLLSPDQKLLTITRVLQADDDIYSCTVENPVGNMTSLPTRLAVYSRFCSYCTCSCSAHFIWCRLMQTWASQVSQNAFHIKQQQ